jgi:hypothetical protein
MWCPHAPKNKIKCNFFVFVTIFFRGCSVISLKPRYKHWHWWNLSQSTTHFHSWSYNMIGPTWFRFWPCINRPIPTMSNISITWSWVRIRRNVNFHEPSLSPYLKFIHTIRHSKEEACGSNNVGFCRRKRLSSTAY